MKLWTLLKQNLLYCYRSKLFLLVGIFSYLIQISGLKIVKHLSLSISGVIQVVDARTGIFTALILQLFLGLFLAAVYGIWMVPYSHQGSRGPLTHTLPVNKWLFPLAYGITFSLLIIIEFVILGIAFEMVFDWSDLWSKPEFIRGTFIALAIETIAFEFAFFAMAFLSMTVGQVATFFIGFFSLFTLQVAGIAFKSLLGQYAEISNGTLAELYTVYRLLPPFGELMFSIREAFNIGSFPWGHMGAWGLWLAVMACLFRLRLKYPKAGVSTET